MLYKPIQEDWSNGKLEAYQEQMVCLDDPNQMELEGQYKHDDGNFLKIALIKCNKQTHDGR